jgi:hypothetical protein
MMMIVPVDADVDETQNVAEENRKNGAKHIKGRPVRDFQLEHHNGDDDGQNAIAESFHTILPHGK